jgi:hypothetical protein
VLRRTRQRRVSQERSRVASVGGYRHSIQMMSRELPSEYTVTLDTRLLGGVGHGAPQSARHTRLSLATKLATWSVGTYADTFMPQYQDTYSSVSGHIWLSMRTRIKLSV